MRIKTYPTAVKIILIVYSIVFLVGTYTHTIGIIRHGLLAFPASLALNVYWDALTLLDPLTVVLLWIRLKVGVIMAVVIMVSDVIINSYAYGQGVFGEPVPGMVPVFLLLQALFCLFVLVTAPLLRVK